MRVRCSREVLYGDWRAGNREEGGMKSRREINPYVPLKRQDYRKQDPTAKP